MSLNDLIGVKVKFFISEPWDFGTEHGAGPFFAKVLKTGNDYWVPSKIAILLQMDTPVIFNDVVCEYLVASTRFEKDDMLDVSKNKILNCS